MEKPKRINVHTHLVSPFWVEGLKSHGGDPSGWRSPEWSPEALLKFKDAEEIAVSVLSLTAPGIEGWHGAERAQIGAGAVYNDIYKDQSQRLIDEAWEINLEATVGIRYMFNERWSANLEGGYRHISNADHNSRNIGLNSLGAGIGLGYHFEPVDERDPMGTNAGNIGTRPIARHLR